MATTYKLPKSEHRSKTNPRGSPGKRTIFVKKKMLDDEKLPRDHEYYSSDPEENPIKKGSFFRTLKDKKFGHIKKTTSSGIRQREEELRYLSAGQGLPAILKYNSTV